LATTRHPASLYDVPVTRLVLWDIDGTLVNAAGFGWQIVQQAYLEHCGSPLTITVALAGRTDRAIFLEALAASGRDERDLPALCQRIGELAEQHRDAMVAQGGRALPGAVEAITALAGQPGVRQSVLSGNLRATGVVKLAALGLLDQLDLGLAAFGDHHVVRADLVGVARKAYAARNGSGPAPQVVLIGDTPLDIAAAHDSEAGIVAVATGHFSVAELEAAGAPIVLPDLTDTHRVVDAVMRA
jgi:phosphoglycolate phosphatase-like HAD superfamily hydrolase